MLSSSEFLFFRPKVSGDCFTCDLHENEYTKMYAKCKQTKFKLIY